MRVLLLRIVCGRLTTFALRATPSPRAARPQAHNFILVQTQTRDQRLVLHRPLMRYLLGPERLHRLLPSRLRALQLTVVDDRVSDVQCYHQGLCYGQSDSDSALS